MAQNGQFLVGRTIIQGKDLKAVSFRSLLHLLKFHFNESLYEDMCRCLWVVMSSRHFVFITTEFNPRSPGLRAMALYSIQNSYPMTTMSPY